ncbi:MULTISPECIES: acyl carrier protein [Streptomyces]|uniref:Actinorhodin polyketide synthase n=2 Tax=Streptomyces TaxID=1883 RepID=A0A2U9P057_STRAS|nr:MULTISPECIES: acyl carrier protein [Streptomyces]AWT42946.1 actinorhodin polyketide synthase [Streptomyces actuosus]MBM4824927.1 acyl carrier protein [Streptomyces actuosus]GHF71532.1 actinorhodin polyketide synthase acyl carrier protein [Streptomyces griseosporeus]
MAEQVFTLDDLRRILIEAAGDDESYNLDGDILDTEFEELGYESLALLETGGRIEREYGISLDEEVLSIANTPRLLIDTVNAGLAALV